MRAISLIGVLLLAAATQPAAAADPAAQFAVSLFTTACVPNLGRPEQVREWAQAHHLTQIEDPVPLSVFVGPGAKGAAWAIPVAQGSFALSIRGTTQACAVWARAADPDEVLANFKKIIEGVKRPGIDVTVYKDETVSSPSGRAHELIYSVAAPGAPTLFLFTLLTVERPGGGFQALMQAARASAR